MLCVAGKNNIAIDVLKVAIERYGIDNVVAIANKTDHGIDGWQRSFRKFSAGNHVPVISLTDAQEIVSLVFVSVEFDQLIRIEKFLSNRLYNIHFSALPKYRGLYTSVWPILFGDMKAAVTLHQIDSGIDTGDIIAQKEFLVGTESTSRDLYYQYLRHGTSLILEWLDTLVRDKTVAAVPQTKTNSSYYSKASTDFSNIVIDFNKTGWEIVRQIKAFCFREYQLPQAFGRKIVNARVLDNRSQRKPGVIVRETPRSVVVSSTDYDVELYEDKLSEILIACERGDLRYVKDHLNCLSCIDDQNSVGWSPLIVAAYNGQFEIARVLVGSGADINGVNYKGTSVLMYAKDAALRSGDTSIFRFLVNAGSDPYRRDHQGKTLFDYISQGDADFLGFGRLDSHVLGDR